MDGQHHRDQATGHEAGLPRRAVVRGLAGAGAAAALLAAGWRPAAAAQEATPPANGPVAIIVLFGEPTDPEAFEAYYHETHVPLVLEVPQLVRLEGGRFTGTLEGEEAPYHRLAKLTFASRAALESALAAPDLQAAFADVPNFATGGATALVMEDLQARPGPAAPATPTP